MELSAVIAAMEWVCQSHPTVSRVQIFSDSKYVIDGVPRAPYWQKNKWRNLHGRPMEHPDLWKEFLALRSKVSKTGVRLDFGLVKGKSDPLLKKVDKAAKQAAKAGMATDRGYRTGKIGRPKSKGGAAVMFPAGGQVLVIRSYGSKLVGKTDENKVTFEIYNEETNEVGAKYFAYAAPEVGTEVHRQRIFRVQMNGNPKYPQILSVLDEIPLPSAKKPKVQ